MIARSAQPIAPCEARFRHCNALSLRWYCTNNVIYIARDTILACLPSCTLALADALALACASKQFYFSPLLAIFAMLAKAQALARIANNANIASKAHISSSHQ